MYLLQMLAGSVPTGDERDVGLWLIVAVIALALVIVCALLSVISKKK